jgi:hypothetical protein
MKCYFLPLVYVSSHEGKVPRPRGARIKKPLYNFNCQSTVGMDTDWGYGTLILF